MLFCCSKNRISHPVNILARGLLLQTLIFRVQLEVSYFKFSIGIIFLKCRIIHHNSVIVTKWHCVILNSTTCTDIINISMYKVVLAVLDMLGIPVISRNIKY